MKEELGITRQYSEDERLRSYKTVEEAFAEFEKAEAKREALARERGMPMTREEYETRKRRRTKSPRQRRE